LLEGVLHQEASHGEDGGLLVGVQLPFSSKNGAAKFCFCSGYLLVTPYLLPHSLTQIPSVGHVLRWVGWPHPLLLLTAVLSLVL
jgi:hypothetical protein